MKLNAFWNVATCENKIGLDSRITNCNGKNACGDPNFTAAVCFKPNNLVPNTICISGRSCVVEAPFVSWNHIMKQGYWCMPCCILEDNIDSKMKVCSAMPLEEDIRNQYNRHGRCGIEFNP